MSGAAWFDEASQDLPLEPRLARGFAFGVPLGCLGREGAALAWQVGIISMVLMLTCGGRDTSQAAVSAISSGINGCVPA